MPRAIIVIPCYNEANRLDCNSLKHFTAAADDLRLLFVDDGSTDDTWTILEDLPGLRLRLPRNSGKGEAVRQGILEATRHEPRYVGFWDADLSTPLDTIPELVDFLESRPDLQMVFGARVKLVGRTIERSEVRHYLGRVMATFVSMLLGLKVYDTQCGAKLFRVTPETMDLFARPFITRWLFDVEILARWIQSSRRGERPPIEQVLYEYPLMHWVHVGGSKLKPRDYVIALTDLLRIGREYLW